jgi:hypothetical protein
MSLFHQCKDIAEARKKQQRRIDLMDQSMNDYPKVFAEVSEALLNHVRTDAGDVFESELMSAGLAGRIRDELQRQGFTAAASFGYVLAIVSVYTHRL